MLLKSKFKLKVIQSTLTKYAFNPYPSTIHAGGRGAAPIRQVDAKEKMV